MIAVRFSSIEGGSEAMRLRACLGMTLALLPASASSAQPRREREIRTPSSRPFTVCIDEAWRSRWFVYGIGRTSVVKDFIPPPPDTGLPWTEDARSASCEEDDAGVTVRLAPRLGSARKASGTPSADWEDMAALVWRFRKVDPCTLETDWAWPRRIYSDAFQCRTPYDAYAWIEGAPGSIEMRKAIYDGTVRGGRLILKVDPYRNLHGRGTDVAAPKDWSAINEGRRVRFVGTEPHDLVDGRRSVRVVHDVPVDPMRLAKSNREMMEDVSSLARWPLRAGDLREHLRIVRIVVAAQATGAKGIPEAEAWVVKSKGLLDDFEKGLGEGRGLPYTNWNYALPRDLMSWRWTWPVGPEVTRAAVAVYLTKSAHGIEFELPTEEGRREADRVRRLARSVDAAAAETEDLELHPHGRR
jgi:hypothetical protein